MWEFDTKSKFKKQYKKFNKKDAVKKALKQLSSSEDPRVLGIYKKHLQVYAYEIDAKNRILYNVIDEKNTIELIRLGDHKEVYGND